MRATNGARELQIEHAECQVEHANAVMTLMGHRTRSYTKPRSGEMTSFSRFSGEKKDKRARERLLCRLTETVKVLLHEDCSV